VKKQKDWLLMGYIPGFLHDIIFPTLKEVAIDILTIKFL